MTPRQFIERWRAFELKEMSGAQTHFLELCKMLDVPPPDGTENYCFERRTTKDSGSTGRADVWRLGIFAWEYKSKGKDLDQAFKQLREYTLALDSPPILIVSDMVRFRIHTNWTNTESERHEFDIDRLEDLNIRRLLKDALTDPEKLHPETPRRALTEEAAAAFAELSQSLRERGHEPNTVAHFVNRMVFCMFAEDVGLLPDYLFTELVQTAERNPDRFDVMARSLFGAMEKGGSFGTHWIKHFNGGLFDDDTALPLKRDEIGIALKAAALDWSKIDPSIMGTLFERGLDPDKRSQLGAHYTDREKIMQIVEPVVIEPLRSEWQAAKENIRRALRRQSEATSKARARRHRKQAEELLGAFAERLRAFRVLDPACGSGNFLLLALGALLDFEEEVMQDALKLGLDRLLPVVLPDNVKGIEINTFAAELARVSIWIGHIQWMLRNSFGYEEPILKHLDAIECRDAIVVEGGGEADSTECDVVIGNPPFLGGKLLRRTLGDDYVSAMFEAYEDRVPKEADLVAYWLVKAGEHIAAGKAKRAGLVTTNSIRGGANRSALRTATDNRPIYKARSDDEWVVEGAAVRISIVCFAPAGEKFTPDPKLDDKPVDAINADLTAVLRVGEIDMTKAERLPENAGIGFMGNTKGGPFDVPGDVAREWLRLPSNSNGKPNADVLKPWMNGMNVTRRPMGKWIVDFGWQMSEEDAALYEEPFQYALVHVQPKRLRSRASQKRWWRHERPRPEMWRAFEGLPRYIATPAVAKHRVFVWLDARICPDHALIVAARDDDTTFGILHSRFHEAWTLRLCTWLGTGNDPRYTPTTTFETYPFPEELTPDIPATDYADDPRAVAIAAAARRLIERREHWLNPPEWVEWVDEPVPGYPKRPLPKEDLPEEDLAKLKRRTLTVLYNERPQWLDNAHKTLDHAVAAAYGWEADIGNDEALRELLALNRARAG